MRGAKLRGIDTNVLVRYIANDDLKQAEVVDRLFRDCSLAGEDLFVPVIVLCELVWVLDRVHGQTKLQIVEVLERLLGLDLLRFEQESVVRQSLISFRAGKASFPDYVIGEIGRQAGCRDTVSFDRDLRKAPGFTVLG
jgi:predicted nucleic-acid-binding protein